MLGKILGGTTQALVPGLLFLLLAWALTYPRQDSEEGLLAMDFPSNEFVQLSFSDADWILGRDLVMRSMVEVPEVGFLDDAANAD